MADIQIRQGHHREKRTVCAVSELGRQWMLRNMGRNTDDVFNNHFQMVIDADTLEDFISELHKHDIEVDIL